MMETLSVISAEYVGGLSLKMIFSDGAVSIVDFEPFLTSSPHPQHGRYLQPELFKTFSIESGNVVWGKGWDMIFPVEDLYSGKISH